MRRFGLLSLALHVALLVGLVAWFQHTPHPVIEAPDTLPTVELVMREQKGSGPTRPPIPPATPAPKPAKPEANAEPTPPPANQPQPSEAAPPPQAPSPPATPATQTLQVNIGGNDSETNAIVTGDRVIPAGIDATYHNREPVYPPEAVRHAEQGAVLLRVHIAPDGSANGVDVAETSGYPELDLAARDAVANWHFVPAVRDGVPIPFDMEFRVVFQLE
jgi:protein TonB